MAIHKIYIPKAGKDAFLMVDDAQFPDDVYVSIMAEGIKAVLNSKMTKVGAVTKLEGIELAKANAAALEIANKNLAALKTGDFKFPSSKSKPTEHREVMNEAIRLAREVIRDQLRANRIPFNQVPAKDITAGAKALVDRDPSYIDKAKAELEARKAVPSDLIDLNALGIKRDEVKAAAAAKAAAERSERAKTLSKTQAGKVKGRQKPSADASTVIAATAHGHKPEGHAVH